MWPCAKLGYVMMSPDREREPVTPSEGPIIRTGEFRKLNSKKKKVFVLKGDAPGYLACLEYYENKKGLEKKKPPTRTIVLRSCFNINEHKHTKYKHVIGLHTKDDCFCFLLDTEKDLQDWLRDMLMLQSGNALDGEQPKPIFEHVWDVTMTPKGLGERRNMSGRYRLCLTNQILRLVKVGSSSDSVGFCVKDVRRCGSIDRILFMEVGRSAVTGDGEFWMEAEDKNIASSICNAILNLNTPNNKDEMDPRQRTRSSSMNESSRPICVRQPPFLASQQSQTFSPRAVTGTTGPSVAHSNVVGSSSSGRRHSVANPANSYYVSMTTPATTMNATGTRTTGTPSSTCQSCVTVPTTGTGSTATVSHQRTLSLPVAAAIMGPSGRERCDSVPSRARTTSEGHPPAGSSVGLEHPKGVSMTCNGMRPHSMIARGLPQAVSLPNSPDSGGCSTDSTGSMLSTDDGVENALDETACGHSLSPDILEEFGGEYALWSGSPQKSTTGFKAHSPTQSSYVEKCSPCYASPGPYLPMSPIAATYSSHSRGFNIVGENNTVPDGYVPMAPHGDDGYVDMEPTSSRNGNSSDDASHGGSSSSMTSGTPSTDLRFSKHHLDKVTSFLTLGEDLQARQTRAYSVGSRPDPANKHRKNRMDINQQESSSRVRAFSVGSHLKRPEIVKLTKGTGSAGVMNSDSSMAPLLSSSSLHSGCSGASDRMEDLMELDFSRPTTRHETSTPNTLPLLSSTSSLYSTQSQQAFSTANDTSSYVDMSPGQPPASNTAPYVDMSGINKINRSSTSTITASQSHGHPHVSSSVSKSVITTLKPVEEAEGPYMRMDRGSEDWSQSGASPKYVTSPLQDDYVQTSGPPGGTRSAPVDLPQSRAPTEDYVEMYFNSRPSLEQDYMNVNVGTASRGGRRTRKEDPRFQAATSKSSKPPGSLPLNGSPASESTTSTPASPPRSTGSLSSIFSFSLNSPQSPVKPPKTTAENNDYTPMEPSRKISGGEASSSKTESSSLARKLSELTVSKSRAATSSGQKAQKNSSPKFIDETPTPTPTPTPTSTPTPTPTSTPTPTPSPRHSEEYDKQSGDTSLHYASLDLPESTAAPVSPAANQDAFTYAEIDFGKLKQN